MLMVATLSLSQSCIGVDIVSSFSAVVTDVLCDFTVQLPNLKMVKLFKLEFLVPVLYHRSQ